MPGTGKTTTIASIIKILVNRGKSVLLTSYTHSAVDNILMKLLPTRTKFMRLGSMRKIHKDLHSQVSLQREAVKTVSDAERDYFGYPVVATTCLGIGHAIFLRRQFDYCIVDEASQILFPVCVGPIRFADKFVLVGDHYQLPPILKSSPKMSDVTEKYSLSMFKHLCEAHPIAVTELSLQYRMNETIMSLVSQSVYNGKLKCGSAAVAGSVLKLGRLEEWFAKSHCKDGIALSKDPPCFISSGCNQGKKDVCWLYHCLNPVNSVVFLDTDSLKAEERTMKPTETMKPKRNAAKTLQSEAEAKIVLQIVEAMLYSGLSDGDIGIISPYRMQIRVIHEHLSSQFASIEASTVDTYQGRDKPCIIISLGVTHAPTSGKYEQQVSRLLMDWRRINVAMTRAKSKLILIGSRGTLSKSLLFECFLNKMDVDGAVSSLPYCSAWQMRKHDVY